MNLLIFCSDPAPTPYRSTSPTPILLRHRVGMVSEHLSDSDMVSEQYRSTSPTPILLRHGVGEVSEQLSDSDTVSELCRSDTVLLRNLSDIVPKG